MAGTVSVVYSSTPYALRQSMRKLVATCTADVAAATFPDTTISVTGRVVRMITNPGATAPTPNYDITVEDAQSVDVLGDLGLDRSATVTEQEFPIASVGVPLLLAGDYTLKIANNAVNSAIVVFEMYWIDGAV